MPETRQIKHSLRYVADKMLTALRTKGGWPAPMGSPPTIALGAHNSANTISGGVYVPATDTSFSYLGSKPGKVAVAGASWNGYQPFDFVYGAAVNAAGGNLLGGQLDVVFGYGGRYLDICARGRSTVNSKACRIWIDRQVTALTPRNDLSGASLNQRYIIDLGSARPRTLRFEMDPHASFGGVVREPNYDVWQVPDIGPRLMGISDSYFQGGGLEFAMTNCFRQASTLLGIADAWNQSEGGLGFVDDSIGSLLTAQQKLASEVLPHDPDWVILALGINDDDKVPADVQAAATLYLHDLMEGLPHAGVTMIGPWRAPGLTAPDTVLDAIKAAALAHPEHGRRLMYFDTKAENWQQIAGRSDAPSGVGNSNSYIGPDNAHPTQPGHDYLAARIANAVTRHLVAVTS